MLVLSGLGVAGSVRQAGAGYSDQIFDMDVCIQRMAWNTKRIYSHVNSPILTYYSETS